MPGVVINISGDGAAAQEALRLIEEKMQETAARGAQMSGELETATRRLGEEFERSVPRVAAASGAIREFEGTLPIRAVERFLTDVLGMGPILQAAFPLIGAVAFGEMLARIGKEIFDTENTARHAAETIRDDWSAVNQELTTAADSLDTKIDQLNAETDKLLNRQGANRLAEMFDESREAADRLGKSIEDDIKKAAELESKSDNKVGFWGGLLSGSAPTGGTEKLLAEGNKQILSVKREYDGVLSRAASSGNQENIDQAQMARIIALQNVYSRVTVALRKDLDDFRAIQDGYEASGHSLGRDVSANINLLSGALDNLDAQQRKIGASYAEEMASRQKTSVGDGGKQANERANAMARTEEEAQRVLDQEAVKELAQLEAISAAKLKLSEAGDSQLLQQAKSSSSLRQAQLEEEHAAGLMSQNDFLERRLALNQQEIDQEIAALQKRKDAVSRSIGAEGAAGDNPKKIELQAQQLEIETKIQALEQQRAIDQAKTTAEINAQVQLQKNQQSTSQAQFYQDMINRGLEIERRKKKVKGEIADQAGSTVVGFMEQTQEAALKGKMSFKEAADSMIMDLMRLADRVMAEQWIIPALRNMFGLGIPSAGAGGGGGLAVINTDATAVTDLIPDVPMDAGGGDIPSGGMAVVGDGGDGSGSELFAPKGPGTVLPHDVVEGIAKGGGNNGGAPNVIVNNVNNSSANVAMRNSGVSWDAGAKQFVINTLLEDMQMGGPTSQAMRGMSASGG